MFVDEWIPVLTRFQASRCCYPGGFAPRVTSIEIPQGEANHWYDPAIVRIQNPNSKVVVYNFKSRETEK